MIDRQIKGILMKVAFITGITGQDGSYLAELLLKKDYIVYGMVRMSSVNNLDRIEHLLTNSNLHIVYGDLLDEASIFRCIKESNPDEIYNLAGQSHVGLSPNFSEYTTDVNGLGLLRIINVIYSLGIENKVKVYQAITSDIFGNIEDDILNEKTAIKPINPYACSKAYAYLLAKSYRENGLFIVNGIAFSHESKRRQPKFVTRKITKAAVRIKNGKQDKLELGNLSVERDWGHAKDFAKGMYLSMQKEKSDDYVFATGKLTSLRDFCTKVFKKLDIDIEFKGSGDDEKGFDKRTGKVIIEINPIYSRKNEKMQPLGDYSKAKQILGWEPTISIDEIIEEMVEQDLKEENFNFSY